MFGLHGIEYFVEVGTTKVRGCFQPGKDATSGHPLEMLLANVLQHSLQRNY